MKQNEPDAPKVITSGFGPVIKPEVDRLRELIVQERRAAGDALLALDAKQKELVAVQGENNRLRVVAADKAQAEHHLMQWKVSYRLLQDEADTLATNNRAYKRANWLLCITVVGLSIHILVG